MMTAIDCSYEIILDEMQIRHRVRGLGRRITEDYKGKDLFVVGILKGSFVFLSDLIRSIDLPMNIDFISVSSYGCEMESSGVVRLLYDLANPIKGRDVLLVEDIVDTGLTMKYLVDNLSTRDPRTIKVCSFLDKKEARSCEVDLKIDYMGFEVPKKFLVGYGLDYNEKYRNLPFIAAIKGTE